MQLLVSLLGTVPSSVLSAGGLPRWQEMLQHVNSPISLPAIASSVAFLQFPILGRVSDVVIGLSCLAIAAAFFSFIIAAGKLLPFRVPFILLAVVVTICGFTHMTAAVLPSDPHVWLVVYLSGIAVLLALIIAAMLPFVLPYALSVLRTLPQPEVSEQNTLVPSITPSPARSITPPPTPPSAEPLSTQPSPQSFAPPQIDDARLRAATESSLDAFFIFEPLHDSNGKVNDFAFKWMNSNGETLLQKPSRNILGRRLTELLPIDSAPSSFEQYRLVLLTGKPYIHEFPLKENDVYSTWMRHHVVKLEDGIAITVTDITERRHTEQYLLHLAQHDALTGLPTRALLDDRILQAIARANRYRTKVAVFFASLEAPADLKALHGSSFEDQVMLAASNRLRSTIRSTDSIIRMGGEEFVIVMTDIAQNSDIRRAAATLTAVLGDPVTVDEKPIQISCSLGVSIYPDSAVTVQDLLSGADVAMYRARSHGKNKFVVFTPLPLDEAEQRAG